MFYVCEGCNCGIVNKFRQLMKVKNAHQFITGLLIESYSQRGSQILTLLQSLGKILHMTQQKKTAEKLIIKRDDPVKIVVAFIVNHGAKL